MAAPSKMDFERLEAVLKSMASANRLRILQLLAQPTFLDDIRLAPTRAQAGKNPGRPISRPAVLRHLRQLQAQGIVGVRRTHRKGAPEANLFVADRSLLYGLLEDLRQLANLGSDRPFEAALTHQTSPPTASDWPVGPKLVLVRGSGEGRGFSLSSDKSPRAIWAIGRRPGSDVRLDYDPFVSMDHCTVAREEGGFVLRGSAEARNGTWLNWIKIEPSLRRVLEPGDIIGVGRSLLVFRDH